MGESETCAIRIEVVYAMAEDQTLIVIELPAGATVRDAIARSGVIGRFPAAARCPIGVFGREVDADTILRNGDRVELYRPLIADPKEARRRRARRPA